MYRRAAGRDEGLVVFIGRAVACGYQEGQAGAPPIGAPRACLLFREGTPEKDAEDAIFRKVSPFPNAQVDHINRLTGEVREEMQQEWDEKMTRVLGGEGIGGGSEDQGHPEENRNPWGKAGHSEKG